VNNTLVPKSFRSESRALRSNAGAPISRAVALPGRIAERTFKYSIWTKLGTVAMGNLAHTYSFTFAIADLPDTQEVSFAEIYKMYRIDRITCKFVPVVTNVTGSDWRGSNPPGPVVHQSLTSAAVQFNDSVTPANESEVLGYENVALHPTFGQPWELSFIPRAKLDTNNVNSIPVASPWIDTANLGVAHYGLKICVADIGGYEETTLGAALYVRYDLSFKTVH